jgi:CRISPR-associated protein (TIGR03984 family)
MNPKESRWEEGLCYRLDPVALPQAADLSGLLLAAAAGRLQEGVLLGTADDGVLWGRLHEGRLVMSRDATDIGALLRRETVQALRLFGPEGELRLWRRGGGLHLAWGQQGPGEGAALDEEHPLLGARAKREEVETQGAHGVTFSILRGTAGEVHAPPVFWRGGRQQPQLKVRHYLTRSASSMMWRLAHTRWMALTTGEVP